MIDRTLSLIGWGMPTDPRTFSGYSRSLALALKARGLLRREYSAKQVGWLDAARGAVTIRRAAGRLKPVIRRAWMWSDSGGRKLSDRINRAIREAGDSGRFLQFGSLLHLDPALGPNYVLTDMTIPQARRAGWFEVSRFNARQIDVAQGIQSRAFHQATHTFTFTEWAKNSIVEDYGVHPSKVTAVYTGPNFKIAPSDAGVPRQPHQILFVGIDWERKGGPELVEAFRMLRRRLPDAELVVAGCSPQIHEPGVRVEGFLHPGRPDDYHRLVRLYRESSCFALMSDFEPLGIVMVEAYSAGLPVVAYDSGSRREIIRDGETGVLCPNRDPETIAEALHAVLHDDEKRSRMGQAARRCMELEFNWERVVERIDHAIGNGTVTSPTFTSAAH